MSETEDTRAWLYDVRPVATTVQMVADRMHQDMYGPDSKHAAVHSCPCHVQAAWLLGLADKPKMYWPDGKGGNVHDQRDPRAEHFRFKDAVVEAAKARVIASREWMKQSDVLIDRVKTRNIDNALLAHQELTNFLNDESGDFRETGRKLDAAVDALLEFESKQQ